MFVSTVNEYTVIDLESYLLIIYIIVVKIEKKTNQKATLMP